MSHAERSDNTPPALVRGAKVHYEVRSISPRQDSRRSKFSACSGAAVQSSEHIHVREYRAPNWFTTWGVLKKRRQIELRGLPSFKEWRFIALTLDPSKFSGPLDGYLRGKDRLRRWMTACREAGLWDEGTRWCWKFEFHKSGWPHWHVLVGRTEKFTHEQLKQIEELWGLGDTDCEMVRQDDFLYSFKYAFKPVFVDPEGKDASNWTVPEWFMDYTGVKLVTVKWTDADGIEHCTREVKATTFSKVRFWQTSKDFYTGVKPDSRPQQDQKTWAVPVPVRVMAERVQTTVQVVSRERSGKYRKSAVILLACTAAHVWHLAAWHAVGGNATFLRVNSAVIPKHIITNNTIASWQTNQLLQDNRLTNFRAARLQARGETLQRS